MADIRWTAVASDAWIELSANGQRGQTITGEGNTNIGITVTPSTPGSSQVNGTITITSSDGELTKVITVQRCGNDCGCEQVVPVKDTITFNWDDDEDAKQTVLTLPNCVQEQLVSVSSPTNFQVSYSEVNYEYTLSPNGINDTEYPVYDTLTIKYGECSEIVVNLVQDTNGCTCEKVVPYDINWDSDKSTNRTLAEVKDTTCFSLCTTEEIENLGDNIYKVGDIKVQFTYPSGAEYRGWFEHLSVSSDKTKIFTRVDGDNPDSNARESEVTIIFGNGTKSCDKSCTLMQDGLGACECGSLMLKTEEISWDADSYGEWKVVATGTNSRCVNNLDVKIVCDKSGHFVNNNYDDGRITVRPMTPNTDTEDIVGTVVINYSRENMPGDEYKCAELTKTIVHKANIPLYIHATYETSDSTKTIIQFTGGTATIRYYLSNFSEDDESKAITDEGILGGLNFVCPSDSQINCGANPTPSNGIFVRTVTFGELTYGGGEQGKDWEFTISHQAANNSPKKLTIYQASKYENIIPNCDYFVFRYNWETDDGKDLDSLTHITNLRNFVIDNKNISGNTVGYGGTSNGGSIVASDWSKPFLKFGGDNQCNGSEYTIICLKNILKYGQQKGFISNSDKIWIDVYANWWKEKGTTHNMQVKYDQYTGLTENGNYTDEIKEVAHEDCVKYGTTYTYYSFEPKSQDTCKRVDGTSTVTSRSISVNAAGSINHEIAKNTDALDGAYTHAFRLIYDVGKQITSFFDNFTDVGVDTMNSTRSIIENGQSRSISYSLPLPDTRKVLLKNMFLQHDLNGALRQVFIFGDRNTVDNVSYITVGAYDNEVYGWYETTQTLRYTDIGITKNFTFVRKIDGNVVDTAQVTNFLIEKLPSGMLNITFDIDNSSRRREVGINIYVNGSYIVPNSAAFHFGTITIKQNE